MKRFLSTPDFCIDLPQREMLAQKTQSEKSGKTIQFQTVKANI